MQAAVGLNPPLPRIRKDNMKKIVSLIAAMSLVAALGAVQVVDHEDKVKGCERLGETSAGNLFATMDKETAIRIVKAQAKEMNADKVFVSVTAQVHGKLGKQYTAKRCILEMRQVIAASFSA